MSGKFNPWPLVSCFLTRDFQEALMAESVPCMPS